MILEYLLPLLSAFIYVVGALFLKRAVELTRDVWRTTCLCNVLTALFFVPLLALGGSVPSPVPWWQPLIVAVLFIAGQTLTLLALRIGDVSIATPVLGLKIVLVAVFTTLILADRLSAPLWIAAALSSIAVALLQRTRSTAHPRVGTTIVTAGLAAAAYALFDVLVQKWSPAWGSGRFLPILMGIAGIGSLALWPMGGTADSHSPALSPWRCWQLWAGAVCLGLQSVGIVVTIAVYRHATAANVLYSSRGLWSVVTVWLAGHWFQSREQHLGPRILAWRLCGAVLLLAAILLVVVQ